MLRDERELSLHWRTEASKAFRILDRLWQEPVPHWNGHHTIRDIRQAAHLCRGVMSLLGSEPGLVEEYAKELYKAEADKGLSWDNAQWNVRSVYRERAQQELQSMAPPPVRAEQHEQQEESPPRTEEEALARQLHDEEYPDRDFDRLKPRPKEEYLRKARLVLNSREQQGGE